MNEKEPIIRSEPMPELDYADSLTKAALKGKSYLDLPMGKLGGRLAAYSKTVQVPDAEYFDEENFRAPKTDK